MKFVALITVTIFLFGVMILVGSIILPTLALVMSVSEVILNCVGNFWLNVANHIFKEDKKNEEK